MEITTDVIVSFRTEIEKFSDTVTWPDKVVKQALCQADVETGGRRWGAYQDECHNNKRNGMFYFAAHWLVINFSDKGPSVKVSSEARLNVQSKSVGDESIQYRVPSMMAVENDWLTWSNYGQMFYRLRKRVGMGAIAV